MRAHKIIYFCAVLLFCNSNIDCFILNEPDGCAHQDLRKADNPVRVKILKSEKLTRIRWMKTAIIFKRLSGSYNTGNNQWRPMWQVKK